MTEDKKKLSLNLRGVANKEEISKRALNAFIKNTSPTNTKSSGAETRNRSDYTSDDALSLTRQEELGRIRALREFQKQSAVQTKDQAPQNEVQDIKSTITVNIEKQHNIAEKKGARIFSHSSTRSSQSRSQATVFKITPELAKEQQQTIVVQPQKAASSQPEDAQVENAKKQQKTQEPQAPQQQYKSKEAEGLGQSRFKYKKLREENSSRDGDSIKQFRPGVDNDFDISNQSDDGLRRKWQGQKKKRQKFERVNIKKGQVITLDKRSITARDLSVALSEPKRRVLGCLKSLGERVDEDEFLKREIVDLVAAELGHIVKYKMTQSELLGVDNKANVDEKDLKERPPVVTIMGHIDHGKTTLLDAFRQSAIVQTESGGITQHIGAYQMVSASGKPITFIDTPGHAAFTAMRMRGARVTDIVVLIVAADDGVNEQTVEAIKHAKAADVPIIVAINKIDKSTANPQKVMSKLIQYDVVVEEMGGSVISVNISAKDKINLEKLEEAILLEAEFLELKYNPKKRAEGVVIESKLDKRCGAFATLLVKDGVLETGQTIVVGESCGKIKDMSDSWGKRIKSAPAGMPVEILGLDTAPVPGSEFFVVKSEKDARIILDEQLRNKESAERTTRDYFAEERLKLSLVIKADVNGSAEAIVESLKLLKYDDVEVKIIHAAVGDINDSDILLAQISDAYIIGFRVKADKKARDSDRISFHSIIYEVIDKVKSLIEKMITPETRENTLGLADVKEVFTLSDKSKIAGCFVKSGAIQRSAKIKIFRNSQLIKETTIKSLRHFKDEVKEVKANHECGILLAQFDDLKAGDLLEAFEVVANNLT